ncbi:MAG: hypothetical protein ACREIL_02480 [Nitrospiraceae bacterium]
MSPTPKTPSQAADALYALIPHAVPRATLEEYGIDATAEQARQISREVISLSLFWVRSALQVALPKPSRERVFGELRQRIVESWQSDLGQEGYDAEQYFEELEGRRSTYEGVVQKGGPPVMVSTEAAAILESGGAVSPEDFQKILALLLDLIPVDAIGELVTELDLTDL